VGHSFFVELKGVQTQGQTTPGEVSLGMISILAEKALELGYRNWEKIPVVGGIGDEIFFQGRIVLGMKRSQSRPKSQDHKA